MKYIYLNLKNIILFFVACLSVCHLAGADDLENRPYRSMVNEPIGIEGYTGNTSEEAAHQPITIGLFIPERSGNPVADSILTGAEIAVMEVNKMDGYNGRSFQLVRRWASDPWAAGSKEMIGFVYEDKAVAVISFMGASSHIAQQVAVKTYIPVLTPVSSDPSLTQARVPWMFRLPPDDQIQAAALINTCLKQSDYDSVGMITSLDQDCRTTAKELQKELAKNGYPPLFHWQIKPEIARYNEIVEYVTSFSPDALIIKVNRFQLTDILSALKTSGLACPVLIPWIPGIDSEAIKQIYTSDTVFVTPVHISDMKTKAGGFYQKFMQYDKHPPTVSAIYAYDAVSMVIKAVQLSGTRSDDIRDRIAEMSGYRGASGIIKWDSGGGNMQQPVLVVTGNKKRFILPADKGNPSGE